MRLALLTLVTGLLAACSPDPEPAPGIAEQGGMAIECALNGSDRFVRECRLSEEIAGPNAEFVVRHPDGGFRRLELSESPAGFDAGDGAEDASSEQQGDWVVLTIDNDRYRWKEPVGE
jgi:hypothetical protein